MSNPKALNDDEVAAEMRKMIAFIKQEALEKAREIKVKADEEFAIEKAKIVRQESNNVDAQFERKRKQVQVQKQIEASNQTNKARLRLLQDREQHLDQAFEDARGRLREVTKDKTKYEAVLKDLVLQGLYSVVERDIKVLAKKSELDMVKKAVDKAVKEYTEKAGLDVKTSVEDELPEDCSGGVVIAGYGGRIRVDNTLDARLSILEEQALPEIRTRLFGVSESRKHFN